MEPSIENIQLKRKPRAVSTFLKKTYELLNVILFIYSGTIKSYLYQMGP